MRRRYVGEGPTVAVVVELHTIADASAELDRVGEDAGDRA
jgi:hypothetical protein